MQFFILVVFPWLLLCAADHRAVRGGRKPHVAEQRSIENDAQLFEEFVRDYNRTYDADEYKRRFDIFRKNLDEIDRRNANYEKPVHGITKFADWTSEEFQRLLGYRRQGSPEPQNNCTKIKNVPNICVPDSLDYREQNWVTDVKEQFPCGTCWAFSTTGNVEGQYAKKYNKLVSFSEQQLVDCIKGVECMSGWNMFGAESYLKECGGLMTEADYPYAGFPSRCQLDPHKVKVKLSDCEDFSPLLTASKDENALKKVLVSRGPLAFSLDATALMHYHGGIIEGGDCHFNQQNHGVLLVGYGKEKNTPYWLVKNSWGKTSGENGYFRIKYGVNCMGLMNSGGEFVNALIV